VRLLLIVNSFASSVTARNTVLVHQMLSKGHDVQIVETNRRGHATRFAQDAATRGVDVVVGFGGDGTLNEIATGIARTGAALGVLPGGSTNVFARTIGLPNDPVEAARALVPALEARRIEPVGLGSVNGRYFCFHTGIGYDAAVVRQVERRASAKRWIGHPLFIYSALRTWMVTYDRHHPHFSLSFGPGGEGGQVPDGYFTVVLNTNPYTYLGNRPLDLSPAATLDRGLVAVTFRTMRATAILGALSKALRGGGVPESDVLDERIDLTELTVSSETPFPYQVDGDDLGDTRHLAFRHVPDAMRLLLPY
jgi:diacylglycerol kinase family enzyme